MLDPSANSPVREAEVAVESEMRSDGAQVDLDLAIERATECLLRHREQNPYWCYELEADCTISAEYILMMHYMDEVDAPLQKKIAVYLRDRQELDGGWSLFSDSESDVSCSVKTYYALKLAGDSPDAPHMCRAREAILGMGGGSRSNVFTRITLALFRQVPWRAVPFMPVEILLLPRWFPFRIQKVSYWSRTVMVPLFVLTSLKPAARNPQGIGIRELFVTDPEQEKHYFPVRSSLNLFFYALDRVGRGLERFIPPKIRQLAIDRAERWILERSNGEGGLGAIFPAMVNAYEVLDCLGYPPDDLRRVTAKKALQKLLVVRDGDAYCQPCVSPVWDTALACLTLQAVGDENSLNAVYQALDWLVDRHLLDEAGDWRETRPDLPGGGWPFQFRNDPYPDLDDTAVVVVAMHQSGEPRYRESIRRATAWVQGMQSRQGGFAAFDVDNDNQYLNEVPFADHGALLDPPTSDVSARCASLLSCFQDTDPDVRRALKRVLDFLAKEQEEDGSWFGRWGTNYIYGTWSVLVALEGAGVPNDVPTVRRAVKWLEGTQRPDGGWGEDNHTYHDPDNRSSRCSSTAFQTAWAILGLLAAGEAGSVAVRNGITFLLQTWGDDGTWHDEEFTAPGFPRSFYLKYHGYDKYFPLWALAQYRRALNGAS